MIATYNEFNCHYVKNKLVKYSLTKRKSVRISEFTAKVMNENSNTLFYELVPEIKEKSKGRPKTK